MFISFSIAKRLLPFFKSMSMSDKVNKGPRIMRIVEENNIRKIVYEELKTDSKPDHFSSKLKVFGVERDETFDNYNPERPTEPTDENLIKYSQFYSDYCRIYVKAGDGGEGCFSFETGALNDNSILIIYSRDTKWR